MSAPTFVILIVCFASIALADDFKIIDGKEYKNVKVSRVEPDGIVITFSGGIVKIPFGELSPEIQKKYGYDPQAGAAYSAEQVATIQQANQRVEESNKQRKEAEQQKALESRLSQLQQQEQDLLIQIGRAENAPTTEQHARAVTRQLEKEGHEKTLSLQEMWEQYTQRQREYAGAKAAAAQRGLDSNMIVPPWVGEAEYDPFSHLREAMGDRNAQNAQETPVSDSVKADLQGRLYNVRKEKERIKQELERAQRQ